MPSSRVSARILTIPLRQIAVHAPFDPLARRRGARTGRIRVRSSVTRLRPREEHVQRWHSNSHAILRDEFQDLEQRLGMAFQVIGRRCGHFLRSEDRRTSFARPMQHGPSQAVRSTGPCRRRPSRSRSSRGGHEVFNSRSDRAPSLSGNSPAEGTSTSSRRSANCHGLSARPLHCFVGAGKRPRFL